MSKYSDDQLGQLLSETGRLLENAPDGVGTFSLDDILAEFGQGGAQPAREQADLPTKAAIPVTEELPEPSVLSEVEEKVPVERESPPPQEKVVSFPQISREEEPEPETELIPEGAETSVEQGKVSLEEIMNQTVSSVLDEDDALLEEEVPLKRRLQNGWFGALSALRQAAGNWQRPKRPARPAKPNPPEEPEPDMEQAALESKRLCGKLHRHLMWMMVPVLLSVVLTAADMWAPMPALWLEMPELRCGVLGGLLLIAAILAMDVWQDMVTRVRRRQMTCAWGGAVLTLVCLADCVYGAINGAEHLPFAAVAGLLLLTCQYGLLMEEGARREGFRLADLGGVPPFVVSVTAAGACKQRGSIETFYHTSRLQGPASRWQTALVPMLIATATVLAGVVYLSGDHGENLFWVWSAILSAALPLSLPLTESLPLNRLNRRLAKSGSAVAGYRGADGVSASRRMVLTDNDLFPPGTVSLNGMKIYGEEVGRVLSYAATVAQKADSQISPLLEQLLTAEGGCHLPIQDFQFFEEGGCGGTIRGETVIMGSAYFMKKRKVALPRELKVKTGVFLAVDGQLIAIFAIQYHASRNVDWALRAIRRGRIQPVLAVRGSNITPGLLRQKFGREIKGLYPDVSARLALSELTRESGKPNAIIYREGLMPFAETVIGSRRLLWAVRWGTILCYVGALTGVLLTYYLTSVGAFAALAPVRMLVFSLLWLLPTLLLSGMVRHY